MARYLEASEQLYISCSRGAGRSKGEQRELAQEYGKTGKDHLNHERKATVWLDALPPGDEVPTHKVVYEVKHERRPS